jgi:hypothetical protein
MKYEERHTKVNDEEVMHAMQLVGDALLKQFTHLYSIHLACWA